MNGISLSVRLWVGIPLALIFLGVSAMFYMGGMVIGVMGTDACGNRLPESASLYLLVAWPAVMAISSITPPALFMINVKYYWTLISLFLGIVTSAFWYMGWFFIIAHYCGN